MNKDCKKEKGFEVRLSIPEKKICVAFFKNFCATMGYSVRPLGSYGKAHPTPYGRIKKGSPSPGGIDRRGDDLTRGRVIEVKSKGTVATTGRWGWGRGA